MLTSSLPPGRSTRRSSASASGGSTAPWHSRSAAIAASKLASANGSALTLPRTTGAPDLAAARRDAGSAHSTPTVRRSRTLRPQAREQSAGAAACIQHDAVDPGQCIEQASMQRAIPPHVVLRRVHQRVFRQLHPDPRNDRRCLPCRRGDRKAWMPPWTGGNAPLADVVPHAVAAPVPRVLTDNASDVLRGIALAVLAYLIWTLGDTAAKWVLPSVGVAGAMLWRGLFGTVTVAAMTIGRSAETGWRRLMPRRWGLVLVRSVLSSFVSVMLVHRLAVDEPGGHLCRGLHRAADHDGDGGADAGRADPLAARALHAGGLRRRADHAAPRRRSVDTGGPAAAAGHAGDGADAHHDAAADHDRDAGVPGVLAADLSYRDGRPAAVRASPAPGRSGRLAG